MLSKRTLGLGSAVVAILSGCSATQDLGDSPPVYPIVTHAIADVKAKEITLGLRHGCLVTTDGAVKCWGSNLWTQLGNGTVDDPLKDGMVSDALGLGLESSRWPRAQRTRAHSA